MLRQRRWRQNRRQQQQQRRRQQYDTKRTRFETACAETRAESSIYLIFSLPNNVIHLKTMCVRCWDASTHCTVRGTSDTLWISYIKKIRAHDAYTRCMFRVNRRRLSVGIHLVNDEEFFHICSLLRYFDAHSVSEQWGKSSNWYWQIDELNLICGRPICARRTVRLICLSVHSVYLFSKHESNNDPHQREATHDAPRDGHECVFIAVNDTRIIYAVNINETNAEMYSYSVTRRWANIGHSFQRLNRNNVASDTHNFFLCASLSTTHRRATNENIYMDLL